MFVAVYTKNHLSGFEHCIADFPYLLMNWSMINVLKFLCIVLGNSLGSMFAFFMITDKG